MIKLMLTLILLIAVSVSISAQVPSSFKYQAVARNSSDNVVSNQDVGLRVSVLSGSAEGLAMYVETFSTTTNKYGLINLNIGQGNVISGNMNTIDWSTGDFFIKIEMDINGGTAYTEYGTSQLLSVPYALHAKTAENITGTLNELDPGFNSSVAAEITQADITNWNNKLDTETDPDFNSSVAGGITETDTAYWNNKSEFDGNYSNLTNAPNIANSINAKTIQLNTSDANSSIEVSNSSGTPVFKVDGTGKMTGDGSGLSNIRPVIAYEGGNSSMAITSINPDNPTLVKYVEITVPGSGVILTQATGYIKWNSENEDFCRMSIIPNNIAVGSSAFHSNYFSYLMLSGDHNLTDSTEIYNNFSYSRAFTVSVAGTYRYNLWADKAYASCRVNIDDVNMQLIYFPTGGTGEAESAIIKSSTIKEEENVKYYGIDGNGQPKDAALEEKNKTLEERVKYLEEMVEKLLENK